MGRHTTSTCGWGPSLSPLCPEVESDHCCPACWQNSSERWETGTGETKSSGVTLSPLQCKKRNLNLLSPEVLVGAGRSVHQHPEETPPQSLALPHHLWQQPHHSRPCWPVLTHREARGHAGLFTPAHLPPRPQPMERTRHRWRSGKENRVISDLSCCVFTWTCLPSHPDPSCGPIPRIQYGYSLLCDSVILYQCHSGFKLLGSLSVSCDPNSQQWSPTPPTCQGMKPKLGPGDMAGTDINIFLKTSASQCGLCGQSHI